MMMSTLQTSVSCSVRISTSSSRAERFNHGPYQREKLKIKFKGTQFGMEKGGIIQRDCCIFWTLIKMLCTSLFMQWRSRGWPKAVFTFCCTSSQRTGRTNGIILEKQQENYLLNSDIYLIMQSNQMVESLKNRNKTQMFYFHPQIGNYLFQLELILFILARHC